MKKCISIALALMFFLFPVISTAGDITANGMNQGDIYSLLKNLAASALNRSNSGGGLAASATPATVKIATPIQYTIAGVNYYVAANPWITGLSASQQAASTYCYYLISVNSAGAFTVTKGLERSTDTATLPELPASSAPVGYVKVVTGATPFTFGTTSLAAAGLTVTYADLGSIPTGPSRIGLTGW